MIGKQHFGRVTNFSISIALGLVLIYVGLPIAGTITSLAFIQSLVVNMAVKYTTCDLIPAPTQGQTFTEWIGVKNRLGCRLVSTATGDLVLITCISFFRRFVAVGDVILTIRSHVLPYLLMSGYMVPIIFIPVYERITSILTH